MPEWGIDVGHLRSSASVPASCNTESKIIDWLIAEKGISEDQYFEIFPMDSEAEELQDSPGFFD
jgi:hypothetical protein